MAGTAYYNEIDPYAAQWLRNLIAAGHIAPGDVDERSIEDVHPDDLRPYTQCHFFAGIGVWSYALRRAGWPDDRPVWTGSCPCQPFSAAGKGTAFDDERHLWPHWHWLVQERRPPVVFGEQVASKDADPWVDLVHADLEALGYAFGAVPFPSASVGAPQPRERTFWVACTDGDGWPEDRLPAAGRAQAHRGESANQPCHAGPAGGAADLQGIGRGEERPDTGRQPEGDQTQGLAAGSCAGCCPVNGFWAAADWIECCDPGGSRWRPVEPGTFPLAHGAPARVGRLRAYGNAINAQQAQIFIEECMRCI